MKDNLRTLQNYAITRLLPSVNFNTWRIARAFFISDRFGKMVECNKPNIADRALSHDINSKSFWIKNNARACARKKLRPPYIISGTCAERPVRFSFIVLRRSYLCCSSSTCSFTEISFLSRLFLHPVASSVGVYFFPPISALSVRFLRKVREKVR